MPYVDTEWAVIVEGVLPGSENWANRWTIRETGVGADLDDATAEFRALYTSWAGLCPTSWSATMITFRNLVNSTVVTPAWSPVDGEVDDAGPLPTECALRVSLSAAPGRHGGPFMAGAATSTVDSDGRIFPTFLTGFIAALEDLQANLVAADFQLVLDSPSDTETKDITAVRIGRTFDVIRKRRNNIPEAYINVLTTP